MKTSTGMRLSAFVIACAFAAASPETWRLSRKGDTLVLRPVKGTAIVLR